jgi:hypothetical protein
VVSITLSCPPCCCSFPVILMFFFTTIHSLSYNSQLDFFFPILLISASWVARITGVSHQYPASSCILKCTSYHAMIWKTWGLSEPPCSEPSWFP